jgi:hypothetical protein
MLTQMLPKPTKQGPCIFYFYMLELHRFCPMTLQDSLSSQDCLLVQQFASATISIISTTIPTTNIHAFDIFHSALWNRQSCIFGLLNGYLNLPDDLLGALCDILHISDTVTFIDGFKSKPSSFLLRPPPQVQEHPPTNFIRLGLSPVLILQPPCPSMTLTPIRIHPILALIPRSILRRFNGAPFHPPTIKIQARIKFLFVVLITRAGRNGRKNSFVQTNQCPVLLILLQYCPSYCFQLMEGREHSHYI